jgi:stearoyl-CoA desaturase (delta-9 desaturase)
MLPTLLVALVVGFAVSQAATFCTTVYLHRALTHRALVVHPVVAAGFRVVLWMTTGIRARQWVAVHRKHHAHTDEVDDPHSPAVLGWVRVQLGNVGLYRRVANDPDQVRRYARDLPADRWDRWFLDRAWLGLGIGITILVLLLGPVTGLLAAGLHTGMYLMLNAAVNAVGHTFGRRPHANSATNLTWLALLTSGEGWHNNHHAAPTSAKLGFRRRELDLAWPFIATLRRLRLATVRHVGPLRQAQPTLLEAAAGG